MKHDELTIEQKRGIITLLPKKGRNRLFLNKIIAKILAMRLQLVLPNIINDDQSGYLKGCYIGQNVRILEDISFFTNKINYLVYYFLLTL